MLGHNLDGDKMIPLKSFDAASIQRSRKLDSGSAERYALFPIYFIFETNFSVFDSRIPFKGKSESFIQDGDYFLIIPKLIPGEF